MNWGQRIARAEKRGSFSEVDMNKAMAWTTCAVGEHKGAYKVEMFDGEPFPVSNVLDSLGVDFGIAVDRNDVARARALYVRINRWFARYGAKQ